MKNQSLPDSGNKASIPLFFSAPATLSAPESADVPMHFSGIPYSGGVINDWGFPIVIDLSTTAIEQNMPVLYEHRRDKVIGVSREFSVGTKMQASGDLFSDIDDDAKEIAVKAARGISWQMSVGLFDATAEDVHAGKTITCNGTDITGPVTVLRNGIVREISIVAIGADRHTGAEFFNARTHTKEDAMTDNTSELNALKGEIDELKAKLAAAEERANAAELAKTTLEASARKAEVCAVFAAIGREPTEDAIKPYMALSAEAWSAVSADLKAIGAKPNVGAPGYLFSEQATGEVGEPKQPSLNTNEIYAARRAQ